MITTAKKLIKKKKNDTITISAIAIKALQELIHRFCRGNAVDLKKSCAESNSSAEISSCVVKKELMMIDNICNDGTNVFLELHNKDYGFSSERKEMSNATMNVDIKYQEIEELRKKKKKNGRIKAKNMRSIWQ